MVESRIEPNDVKVSLDPINDSNKERAYWQIKLNGKKLQSFFMARKRNNKHELYILVATQVGVGVWKQLI